MPEGPLGAGIFYRLARLTGLIGTLVLSSMSFWTLRISSICMYTIRCKVLNIGVEPNLVVYAANAAASVAPAVTVPFD